MSQTFQISVSVWFDVSYVQISVPWFISERNYYGELILLIHLRVLLLASEPFG